MTREWRPRDTSPQLRERVFAVIGSFAELSTSVVQRMRDETLEYDVVTGMLAGQAHFRTHRHLVRFRVVRPHPPSV